MLKIMSKEKFSVKNTSIQIGQYFRNLKIASLLLGANTLFYFYIYINFIINTTYKLSNIVLFSI